MEYSSIVHYANKNYCFALSPGKFLIRLETKKDDIDKVILHTQNKYIRLEWKDTRASQPMTKVRSDLYKDYFETIIDLDVICLRYYFELVDHQGQICHFGNHSFKTEPITDIEYMFDCPQQLREEEAICVPSWAKNKVVYQIFPSRFATDQKVSPEVWDQAPIDHQADLKGNLRGIINHLDYLKDLGIDIIYMTPIFKSNSSHKYNIEDYYTIDPSFGTTEDLKELVEKAHQLGLRVILDGVFNHTADTFFAFQDVVEKETNSPYLNWYYIKDFPLQREWGKLPNFLTFGYFGPMPKLNLSNKEVQDYFINVAKYWIETCHIDGWRLDVGDEISHFFWKRFRKEIKDEYPDVLIIGEIWHFAGDFLEGDEWDTVMNYQVYRAIQDLVVSRSITVSEYVASLNFMESHLHPDTYSVLWNIMGSHDTIRFLTFCQQDVSKMKLAAALLLLNPGMPMIYYGDEVGMEGGHDPDCRRGMYWNDAHQNQELLSYYKKLLSLRHTLTPLLEWDHREIHTDNTNGLLLEIMKKGNQTILVAYNCKEEPISLKEYSNCSDLLNGNTFQGILEGMQTIVLEL